VLGSSIGLLAGPLGARDAFELSWRAPADCPSHAEASAALTRLAAAGSELADARVEIERTADGWQGTLSTPGGQRRLRGETCDAVVQALTVMLALAADQASLPAPATAAPERAPAVPPPPLSAPLLPAATGPRSGLPLRWAVRIGIWAEVGMLPGPSLGPRGVLELRRGDWSVELGLGALLPRHVELAGGGSPASDISWFGGQVAACHALGQYLSTCFGVESGRLSGTGSGVDEPIDAHGWWLAGTAAARWRGPLDERAVLSWQLGLGVAAALLRPEFGFDDLGVLHRPSAVSGRLFVGLGWQ